MRRFLRYLRVLFSALCLTAAVGCAVLWVRSYWRVDRCIWYASTASGELVAATGQLASLTNNSNWSGPGIPRGWEWRWQSISKRSSPTIFRDSFTGVAPASLYTPAFG